MTFCTFMSFVSFFPLLGLTIAEDSVCHNGDSCPSVLLQKATAATHRDDAFHIWEPDDELTEALPEPDAYDQLREDVTHNFIVGFSAAARRGTHAKDFQRDAKGKFHVVMEWRTRQAIIHAASLENVRRFCSEWNSTHGAIAFVARDSIVSVPGGGQLKGTALLDSGDTANLSTICGSWGLDRIDARAGYDHAFSPAGTAGSGVHVYVIDTGVRTTHADFGGRAFPAYDFTATPRGCSPTNTTCAYDGSWNGHGTHTAGTVGSNTWGVAKNVTLHAVKVLDMSGRGLTSDILDAMNWVLENGRRPAIMSMSLGGGYEAAYQQAIDAAYEEGVLVVVAAGNSNADACDISPAGVPNAITVGSTTKGDAMSSFSNWGPCVDIWAPGSDIMSTCNARDDADCNSSWSGTSMASPHVAGAAALIYGEDHSRTAAYVSERLLEWATPNAIQIPTETGSSNLFLYVGNEAPTPAPPPTPAPAPTVAPPPPPPRHFNVSSGPCTVDVEGCVLSPYFPDDYGSAESCVIGSWGSLDGSFAIEVSEFASESGYDFLYVNSGRFSGSGEDDDAQKLDGVKPTEALEWYSDSSVTQKGWKLCLKEVGQEPTLPPTASTASPTPLPTSRPTTRPTPVPTASPTPLPTALPTIDPTQRTTTPSPTLSPSTVPTQRPTAAPTLEPTTMPTQTPTPPPSKKKGGGGGGKK